MCIKCKNTSSKNCKDFLAKKTNICNTLETYVIHIPTPQTKTSANPWIFVSTGNNQRAKRHPTTTPEGASKACCLMIFNTKPLKKGFCVILRLLSKPMLSRKYRIETALFPGVTRGKTVQDDLFKVVLKQDKDLLVPKCAVIVSGKVAKTAISRNTLRRQAYSALFELLPSLPSCYISVFPKKTDMDYLEMKESLRDLICSKS